MAASPPRVAQAQLPDVQPRPKPPDAQPRPKLDWPIVRPLWPMQKVSATPSGSLYSSHLIEWRRARGAGCYRAGCPMGGDAAYVTAISGGDRRRAAA